MRDIIDVLNTVLIDSDEPLTLEQIYESVQAQIYDELDECGRFRIRYILDRYCKKNLVKEADQGRYLADFDMRNQPGPHDPSVLVWYMTQESVRCFISTRRKPFTLGDVSKLHRFRRIRDGCTVERFIDSLCESGQLERVGHQTYRPTASFEEDSIISELVDQRFVDTIDALRTHGQEAMTLAQIYESVQAKIPYRLSWYDRRQILHILYSYTDAELIWIVNPGKHKIDRRYHTGDLFIFRAANDVMCYNLVQQSIRDFISGRKGGAFTLRDAYGSKSLYDVDIRNRYMIKKSIDELYIDGQLELVGHQTYRSTASFEEDTVTSELVDQRFVDAVSTIFTHIKGAVTLGQIHELAQVKISGRLSESDRRQIQIILRSYIDLKLIWKVGPGRCKTDSCSDIDDRFIGWVGDDDMYHNLVRQSIRDFIYDRRGESFALRDIYDSCQFYYDDVRNKYVIKEFIDSLCGTGQLERAGRIYRATVSFAAGSRSGPDIDSDYARVKQFELRRKPSRRIFPKDQRLQDAVDIIFAQYYEPLTLEYICESVQDMMPGKLSEYGPESIIYWMPGMNPNLIPGKLSESDRRKIKRILHLYRQRGLIREVGRGEYMNWHDSRMGESFSHFDIMYRLEYDNIGRSIRDLVSKGKKETFTLQDVCGLLRLYRDAAQNKHVIKRFIVLHRELDYLKLVGDQTYRPTALWAEHGGPNVGDSESGGMPEDATP